jgi:serine/threonine-protein kinase
MDGGGGTMTEDLFHIARRGYGISAIASWATIGVVLLASDARGEPGATEKATAEALFQQGTELMGEKQYAAACEKFAGSQQLDPALGTVLRLADCNDRIGKSASAWAMFKEASSMAHTRNEPERWRMADERGAELEKRLSKLEIKLETKNVPTGFELKLNGVSIPRATWDAAIPVDPGKQKLEASAPGRITWTGTVEVPEGPATRSIEVPVLGVKPASTEPNGAATLAAGTAAPGHESASAPGSTQRTIGYVTSAVGIVGIGIGGFLGYRAYSLNKDSLQQCRADDPNACTAEGKSLRDDAQSAATGSTIALVAGGALTVGGLVLVLTAPRSEPRHAGTELKVSDLRVSTGLVGRGPGVSLEGTW